MEQCCGGLAGLSLADAKAEITHAVLAYLRA